MNSHQEGDECLRVRLDSPLGRQGRTALVRHVSAATAGTWSLECVRALAYPKMVELVQCQQQPLCGVGSAQMQ